MEINEYIESGILETYIMGNASETEEHELLYLKAKYPEVNMALQQLEEDMEKFARHMAIAPPPDMWSKIEQQIDGLVVTPDAEPEIFNPERNQNSKRYKANKIDDQYIEVEAQSSYMKIHKSWKWVLAAVFVLGKIFLISAIYFYLENRQAQLQIKELKLEIKQPGR